MGGPPYSNASIARVAYLSDRRRMVRPWDRPGWPPHDAPGPLVPAVRHAPDGVFPVLRSVRPRLRRGDAPTSRRGGGVGSQARADVADLAAAAPVAAARRPACRR